MKGLRPISRNIGGGTIALALLAAAGSLFVVSPASAKDTLVIAIPGLPQGVDLDKPIVTSCGSGVSAAIIALALARLGRWDAPVYDGSWTEWASRSDTEIVTGA